MAAIRCITKMCTCERYLRAAMNRKNTITCGKTIKLVSITNRLIIQEMCIMENEQNSSYGIGSGRGELSRSRYSNRAVTLIQQVRTEQL